MAKQQMETRIRTLQLKNIDAQENHEITTGWIKQEKTQRNN